MVQGLPAVIWTPENNTKLLQALVIMHTGFIDYIKLAAIFGPNVPVAAIQYRFGVLRKEGAALGLNESKSSPFKAYTPKNGNRVGVVSSEKAKGKHRGRGGILSDDASGDQTIGSFEVKTLGRRITKARFSPRKNTKKNYKTLEDPFAGVKATDADGEKIFETDMSDYEDPNISDEEFSVAKQDNAIAVEETG